MLQDRPARGQLDRGWSVPRVSKLLVQDRAFPSAIWSLFDHYRIVLQRDLLGQLGVHDDRGRVDHLCALYARARRSRAAGRIRPELWTAAPADFFLT